jgi:DNA-binding SARP family transcriptional activator
MKDMTTLKIRLLGHFSTTYHEKELKELQQPRLQALLAYLLLRRGEVISRQQLAFLFWPDSTERQAKANLRTLLHRLKRFLPEAERFLFLEPRTVQWRAHGPYELDVAVFEEAYSEAANALAAGQVQQARTLFASAADAYRGDLLPQLYDDWVMESRTQLHNDYLSTLEQLAQEAENLREYPEAIRESRRLLRADPLRETTYRQLMRLHALNGDRATALHVYHTCVTTLARELDVEPSPITQRAYQRLLRLEEMGETRSAPEKPLVGQIPLVGREQAWQSLLRAWGQALKGKSRIILICGEAGIGKTRLAEELLNRVHHQGMTALSTRSYEAEGDLAYAPIANWLREDVLSPTLHSLADPWLVEVSRLLPELLAERPRLSAPGPLTERWQRQRFFEALARAILTKTQPLILHIDDLQWCDEETLTWLHYLLLRYHRQARFLVVGTVRAEEIAPDHHLNTWIGTLQREGLLTEIELEPLSTSETATLAGHIKGRELPSAIRQSLYQETEGNPLFIVESVRAGFVEQHRIPEVGDHLSRVPPKVQAVIEHRLGQLTSGARELVGAAAVIGREFGYAVLAASSGIDEDTLVLGLDELWYRKIIRERGGDAYDFTHDRIREVAYAHVSSARRRLLHRRVAEALEAIYPERSNEISGQLAVHFEQAGTRDKARIYCLQAGEQALSDYSRGRAKLYFDRALGLSSMASHELDALYGLSRVEFVLDDFESALLHVDKGLQLAANDDPRRSRLLYIKADAHMARYEVNESEVSVRQALAAAEMSGDQETKCQGLSLLGQIYSSHGDLDKELELITRALVISREEDNRWREGRTLADLGWLQAQRAEFGTAVDSATQALSLLQERDDQAGIAFAWNILGRAHGGKGDYEAAFHDFEQSRAVAETIDHKFFVAQVPNMLGWLSRQLCDYERALELDSEGVEIAKKWGKIPAEISAEINVQLDRLYLGEPERSLRGIRAVQRRIEEEAFGFHAWRWRLRYLYGQGLCLLALELPERALEMANEGLTLAEKTTSRKYIALNNALAGNALASLDRDKKALHALEVAVGLADDIGYQPLRWQERYRLAQLQTRAGADIESSQSLAAAVTVINTITNGLTEARRSHFLKSHPVQAVLQTLRQFTEETQ